MVFVVWCCGAPMLGHAIGYESLLFTVSLLVCLALGATTSILSVAVACHWRPSTTQAGRRQASLLSVLPVVMESEHESDAGSKGGYTIAVAPGNEVSIASSISADSTCSSVSPPTYGSTYTLQQQRPHYLAPRIDTAQHASS